MSVRIMLADDHAILREGLRGLLEKHRGFEVVADAADGRTAVVLARRHQPDVIVMDISMPGMNGAEATRQLAKELPRTRVVALSVHVDRRYVESMLGAGAAAYLRKDCVSEELIHAIECVMRGDVYISPKIVALMSKHIAVTSQKGNAGITPQLSAKEREVLQLLAEGCTSKEISDRLFISMKTVEKHRQHISEKLGINSVAELTKYAIREGITSVEE